MKFFLDTSNLKEIEQAVETGLIEGVTTNPSLVAKETGIALEPLLNKICQWVQGPVSAEVIATKWEEMVEEGRALASLNEHIVVKIPLTFDGLRAAKILNQKHQIRTNVTLCFSSLQALGAAKVGATYVSPFIGRLDDIGEKGASLIKDIKKIFQNYGFSTKILAASIRHVEHVRAMALAGADVVTMPYGVFRKILNHPLTDLGIEKFLKDWEKRK